MLHDLGLFQVGLWTASWYQGQLVLRKTVSQGHLFMKIRGEVLGLVYRANRLGLQNPVVLLLTQPTITAILQNPPIDTTWENDRCCK